MSDHNAVRTSALTERASTVIGAAPSTGPDEGLSHQELQALVPQLRMQLVDQGDELRQVQAELAAALERLSDFYDLSPAGFFVVNEFGLIVQANRTAATLLEFPHSVLVGQAITRFIFLADQDIYYLLRRRVHGTSSTRSCELRMVKHSGGAFWVHIQAAATSAANGGKNLLIVLTDVSQQHRTQESLIASETFKLAILNSVATEIVVLDHGGMIVAVNEPWRRFARENSLEPGKPASGTDVGANYLTVCPAGTGVATDGAVEACDGIRAVLDGRLPRFTLEYPCHSPQQQRWFSMSVTPLRMTAQGGAVIEHTDISERKRAGQALRIAAIAFECQEGMIITDANRVILRTNQSFTRIMGYTNEEVVGKTTTFMRSDRQPAAFFEAAWDTARQNGSWGAEVWHQRKNGEVFPQWLTSTAVKDELGNITHFVVTHIDITPQKRQEAKRLADEAAHRDTLVREVHHRIKNNLQGITGLLRQFAQKHPETADPMNQAIGQVQGISVIHGLQGRAVTSSVRLCELTGAIADEIQTLWQTPVTVDIPPLWLPCVIAESEAVPLALVLNELIVNAVKHGGKAQGYVRITLRKGAEPDTLQISITNAGQLAPNHMQSDKPHKGLQLIAALMPRHGASLHREQRGDQVVTLLALGPPVISLDQKQPL